MEKDKISAILRKRIQEMGFTQEDFAEKTGISFSTLKKYLKEDNPTPYSYEMLIKFAEALNCSYDYLLGYSESTKRVYHDAKEKTGLSEESIEKLEELVKKKTLDSELLLKVLDEIIKNSALIDYTALYISASKPIRKGIGAIMNTAIKGTDLEGFNDVVEQNFETIYLMQISAELRSIRERLSGDVTEELKKEVKGALTKLEALPSPTQSH